ncbi:MAG: hypothetical protein OEM41_09295, partial [Ignavibacteria bacterium]|nr:hypothetical protein [Ignavibacteria bacterium]
MGIHDQYILEIVAIGSVFLLSIPAEGSSLSQAERTSRYNDIFNNPIVREDTTLPVKCGLPAISYAIEQERLLTPRMKTSLGVVLTRPVMQKSITVGDFRVHYDTTGSNTPAMLNALGQHIPGTANEFADSVASI